MGEPSVMSYQTLGCETYASIAARFGIDPVALYLQNESTTTFRRGITIPDGKDIYIALPGQKLADVARLLGTSVEALRCEYGKMPLILDRTRDGGSFVFSASFPFRPREIPAPLRRDVTLAVKAERGERVENVAKEMRIDPDFLQHVLQWNRAPIVYDHGDSDAWWAFARDYQGFITLGVEVPSAFILFGAELKIPVATAAPVRSFSGAVVEDAAQQELTDAELMLATEGQTGTTDAAAPATPAAPSAPAAPVGSGPLTR